MNQSVDEMPMPLDVRVARFMSCRLPGQPQMTHMGTSYLVRDLWQEVQHLRSVVDTMVKPQSDGPDYTLDDGAEENLTALANGAKYIVVSDPVTEQVFPLVDRRCFEHDQALIGHLPQLRLELNHLEWREMPAWYRGLYIWNENESKFKLDEQWRGCWGAT